MGWNVTEDIKPKIGAGMSALLGSVLANFCQKAEDLFIFRVCSLDLLSLNGFLLRETRVRRIN